MPSPSYCLNPIQRTHLTLGALSVVLSEPYPEEGAVEDIAPVPALRLLLVAKAGQVPALYSHTHTVAKPNWSHPFPRPKAKVNNRNSININDMFFWFFWSCTKITFVKKCYNKKGNCFLAAAELPGSLEPQTIEVRPNLVIGISPTMKISIDITI